MSRGPRWWMRVAVWAAVVLVATSVPLSDVAVRASVPLLDKVVHAGLYGVLGWLVAAALGAAGRRGMRVLSAAVVGIALFAAADEAHQIWMPGRIPGLADWSADVVGAAAGVWARAGRGRGTAPLRENGP